MNDDPTQQPSQEQGPYYEYGNYPSTQEPPAPYGTSYPPYGPPNQGPTATPLPLGQAILDLPLQYWKILSKPSPRTFVEESGKAKWNILLVQFIVFVVL